ncbi:MAG TPA: hypothetical protein VIH57_06630, partial [Bacteroidales bacterium]
MRWQDLKIGYKIGIGFLILIVIAALIASVALINMNGIQKETGTLTKEYIPTISDAFQIDQNWKEITMFLQAYDFTGDDYYLKKAKGRLTKFKSPLSKLIELTSKSERLSSSKNDFITIRSDAEKFEKILNSYESKVAENTAQYKKLEGALFLYRKLNQNNVNRISNYVNEISNLTSLAISEEKPIYLVDLPDKIDKLAAEARANRSSHRIDSCLNVFVEASRQFVPGFIEAKKIELSRIELGN